MLEQVRTIDKQRLKQYLGMIPDNIVARVDKALAISVALEKTKATDV
ncbi:pemK-like family protein [Clostridioides difficile P20]|nr:pemK-like family protein [Clostridioides difficile P19]EQJ32517.1 pemK-like family protein [Clostridioides difficile P20]